MKKTYRWSIAWLSLALAACGSSKSDSQPIDAGDDGSTDVIEDAPDPGPTEEEKATFDALVESLRKTLTPEVPGASIAIVLRGKLAFSAGVGVKRKDTTDPVTADSLFRCASLTKMLVAGAMMLQVEDGAIDLDRPLTDYVPYFKREPTFDPKTVLVKHLLMHTSGVPDEYVFKCGIDSRKWTTMHANDPLWAPPGRLFNYSNAGYLLAGLVLDEVTGTPFTDLVRDRILVPAGMTTATFDINEAFAGDHTSGHHRDADGSIVIRDFISYDCPTMRAWGGMMASVNDYAHLAEKFLAFGGGVLKPTSVQAMEAIQTQTGWTPDMSYGYGLQSYPWRGVTIVGHDGYLDGWKTSWMLVPEKRFAAIVFFNGDARSPEQFTLGTIDTFLGLTAPAADYRTPASTWGKYVGKYVNPWTGLGDMTVTFDGSALHLGAGGLTTRMYQNAGDNFSFRFPAWSSAETGVFFFDDKGTPEFFATRGGVGKRAASAVAVAPKFAPGPEAKPPSRDTIFALDR